MAERTTLVKNWVLKVKSQKKNEQTGNVSMNTFLSGQKNDDGSYCDGMWITVHIKRSGERPTVWEVPADYTGKYVEVDGKFAHSDWERDGKKGKNFMIFADEVREHIFEQNNENGNSGQNF